MQQPNRNFTSSSYRYGFQGQEKDDEIKGEGNSVNYKYRMHDPRVGRFFAVDPLEWKYPFYSSYQFSGNRVIDAIELEGMEELVLTQYKWKQSGETVKLGQNIVKSDGNWKGVRYREAYFFENDESGFSYSYYDETGNDKNGTAWLKMENDNPHYFKALNLYHDFQARKSKRVVGDGAIILGGIITTVVSGGSGTGPYMAATGMTSGIYSIGAGTGKLISDANGDFDKSDKIPGTVLGGFGAAIDRAQERDDYLYQDLGDIANSLILLFGGNKSFWTKWDAASTTDKVYSTTELIRATYAATKKHFNEDTAKEKAAEEVKILEEYRKIVQANKKEENE